MGVWLGRGGWGGAVGACSYSGARTNENAAREEFERVRPRPLDFVLLQSDPRLIFPLRSLSSPELPSFRSHFKSCIRDKMAAATSRYYSEGGRATKRQKTDSDGMTTVCVF